MGNRAKSKYLLGAWHPLKPYAGGLGQSPPFTWPQSSCPELCRIPARWSRF